MNASQHWFIEGSGWFCSFDFCHFFLIEYICLSYFKENNTEFILCRNRAEFIYDAYHMVDLSNCWSSWHEKKKQVVFSYQISNKALNGSFSYTVHTKQNNKLVEKNRNSFIQSNHNICAYSARYWTVSFWGDNRFKFAYPRNRGVVSSEQYGFRVIFKLEQYFNFSAE